MTRKHLIALAHEIWSIAQLPPGRPIEWAVDRIALILHDYEGWVQARHYRAGYRAGMKSAIKNCGALSDSDKGDKP